MRRALALGVIAVLAGCGVPQEPAKQAEQVRSVAAEGALLAHEASEGSYAPFTREHAKALRKLLDPLRPAIEEQQLARVADDVDGTLGELAADPGDRQRAAAAERALDRLASAAERLAG